MAQYSTSGSLASLSVKDIVFQAGHLYIERLEEFPAERGWRFRQGEEITGLHHLPGSFLLVARKGS